MASRTEKDFYGSIKLPKDAPWGMYTQRQLDTYPQDGLQELPEDFLRCYVQVKMIYATVNARFRKISQEYKRAIHAAGKDLLKLNFEDFMQHFPVGVLQIGGGSSTNMMINEVLANLAGKELGWVYGKSKISPYDHLNLSQSSNDTFPGVSKIVLRNLAQQLLSAVETMRRAMQSKARKRNSLEKRSRTHLQDAILMTVGNEFSAFARTLEKNEKLLKHSMSYLLELPFGGGLIGSLHHITPAIRKELYKEIKKKFGDVFLPPKNYFEQNSSSGDIAFFSQSIVHLSNDLIKIGNDLRVLSASALGEIVFSCDHSNCSVVPGKTNPSIIEALIVSCAKNIGTDVTVQLLSRSAQLQSQPFYSGIVFPLIQSLSEFITSIQVCTTYSIQEIQVDRKKIQYHLEQSVGGASKYIEVLGYDKVTKIIEQSRETGVSFLERIEAELKKLKRRKKI